MCSIESTASAPADAMPEAGMVLATAVSGSWTQAVPPRERTAARPSLPSSLPPVSSSASNCAP